MTKSTALARIIGLLIISNGHLSRTKQFEPDYEYTDEFIDFALFDEITVIDATKPPSSLAAARYGDFVDRIRPRCFLPLTLGGDISSVGKAEALFELGADRVVIGSAALTNPRLVTDVADRWGSQAVVASISALRVEDHLYAVSSRSPRSPLRSAKDVVTQLQDLGAGEIFLNFVQRDGSLQGPDVEGARELASSLRVPGVLAGGIGNWTHMLNVLKSPGLSGVATSNIFHLTPQSVLAAKQYLSTEGVPVRLENVDLDWRSVG
jgi:cyclase